MSRPHCLTALVKRLSSGYLLEPIYSFREREIKSWPYETGFQLGKTENKQRYTLMLGSNDL